MPRAGQARLLASPRLEVLTRTHPVLPAALFLPVVGGLLWGVGVLHPLWDGELPAAVLAGLCLWTLTEYVLHRGLFHLRPRRRVGITLAYLIHGVHHAYPTDRRRLVMPPIVTVPLSVLIYLLFIAVLGAPLGPAIYAGFLTGYVAYDTLHYVLHARRVRVGWLAALQRNHMRHHFEKRDRRFGVSTTVWDHVFRTR